VKRLTLPVDAIDRARRLRRDATPAERAMQVLLQEAFPASHFRFQVPFDRYIVDFASHCAKLIIEVDGDSHAHQVAYDAQRTEFLEGQGYRVLRFWNADVLNNPDGVFALIEKALPTRGEGLGWGPDAIALGKKFDAVPVSCIAPTPRPPHMGEGAKRQSLIGVC
jgi:very-short-patch-repair endonuclease